MFCRVWHREHRKHTNHLSEARLLSTSRHLRKNLSHTVAEAGTDGSKASLIVVCRGAEALEADVGGPAGKAAAGVHGAGKATGGVRGARKAAGGVWGAGLKLDELGRRIERSGRLEEVLCASAFFKHSVSCLPASTRAEKLLPTIRTSSRASGSKIFTPKHPWKLLASWTSKTFGCINSDVHFNREPPRPSWVLVQLF